MGRSKWKAPEEKWQRPKFVYRPKKFGPNSSRAMQTGNRIEKLAREEGQHRAGTSRVQENQTDRDLTQEKAQPTGARNTAHVQALFSNEVEGLKAPLLRATAEKPEKGHNSEDAEGKSANSSELCQPSQDARSAMQSSRWGDLCASLASEELSDTEGTMISETSRDEGYNEESEGHFEEDICEPEDGWRFWKIVASRAHRRGAESRGMDGRTEENGDIKMAFQKSQRSYQGTRDVLPWFQREIGNFI
ncbi:hypothetical protein F0562_005811 [Nyssa sinensis]|uniref:Uncharacterized protein n=1 Tax=Nyssa sinensis TaxID=561372 RepID=A0A5J5AMV7_9ASTE|nr:hypothetical protein F0562_005811 [Nyssa sinensis]